ncbi:MAG TPA: cyclodeaminase/cyclohydrolase family protein [Candidatus Dormibacteraeota bacterium]|jgi:formiminotetrahydrofolate cyclodeaminase
MTEVVATSVGEYLDRLASASAVPGGGSAAAVAAAMGVALVAMVARISAKKVKDAADRTRLLDALPELDELRTRLARLSQEDIDAYQAVLDIRRKDPSAAAVLQEAYGRAAEVPLETAQAARRALELCDQVSPRAWAMTQSDLQAGKRLLETGLRAALANVEVNLPDLQGSTRLRLEREWRALGQ